MPSAYRQFNRRLATLVAGALAAVAAVNVAVDPVGLWGTPTLRGFNAAKPRQGDFERLVKAQAVMRLRPKALILGSSRARLAIQPADYRAATGHDAFNLALGGPEMLEVAAYFHHALALQPGLSDVLLNVEYYPFAHHDPGLLAYRGFTRERLERGTLPWSDYADHTLTFAALANSWQTIGFNRERPDWRGFGAHGEDVDLEWRAATMAEGPVAATASFIQAYVREPGHAFRYDPRNMAYLRDVVDTCRARGIRLVVATAPLHAVEQALIYAHGDDEAVERWERDLAAITPYWDFSGFNAVTTAPVAADMPYIDPTHARPVVGRRMLARLYGHAADGFGVWTDAASLGAHQARRRADRRAWLAAHPQLAQQLHAWPPMRPLGTGPAGGTRGP